MFQSNQSSRGINLRASLSTLQTRTFLTFCAFAAFCAAASADVGFGTSSGTPLMLNVTSTANLDAVVSATTSVLATPLASASGTAPNTYSTSGGPIDYTAPTAGANLSILNVSAGVNTTAISANALTNSASSDVDGASGNRTTTSSASLTGLDVGFGAIDATIDNPVLPDINLDVAALSITTGLITSTSTVTGAGTGTAFDASFSNSVLDFDISIFGVSILSLAPVSLVADLEAGAPVNVTINLEDVVITLPDGLSNLNAFGLVTISNSGVTSDTIPSGSASATALTISLQGVSISADIGNLITVGTQVNGTISAAQTAAVQAVPEPSGVLLLAGSLAALLVFGRRRRPNR